MKNKIDKILSPANECLVCGKTLVKAGGGRRIVAQKFRGVGLVSNKHKKSERIQLYDDNPQIFLAVWGDIFSQEILLRAHQNYINNYVSWFCQICGKRVCSTCGSPTQMVPASDLLDNDCSTHHSPIFPCSPGCVNPNCKNHRTSQ